MNNSVDRVLETAKVFDFIPLMAYRFTRERLNAIRRARRQDAQSAWDVVFVSLSGGGRGQIAAALTSPLSGTGFPFTPPEPPPGRRSIRECEP